MAFHLVYILCGCKNTVRLQRTVVTAHTKTCPAQHAGSTQNWTDARHKAHQSAQKSKLRSRAWAQLHSLGAPLTHPGYSRAPPINTHSWVQSHQQRMLAKWSHDWDITHLAAPPVEAEVSLVSAYTGPGKQPTGTRTHTWQTAQRDACWLLCETPMGRYGCCNTHHLQCEGHTPQAPNMS